MRRKSRARRAPISASSSVLSVAGRAVQAVGEGDRLGHQALGARALRRVDQVARALGPQAVGDLELVSEPARVEVARDLRELVDDRVGLGVADRRDDRVALERVDDHRAAAVGADRLGAGLPAGRPDHLVPGGHELPHERPPDRSRRPGYEHAHAAKVACGA